MKISDVKTKAPKDYQSSKELNRVYCQQVPWSSLSADQQAAYAAQRGGPRHARRILEKGGTRLGKRKGTVANVAI